jgi:hypothetical protein
MLSSRSRIRIVGATIAAAAVGTAAALASPASDPPPPGAVTVDQSAVARHRALGRLGDQVHVFSDSAVIARHRALGRLPMVTADPTVQAETGSSSWLPRKEFLFGFAVVATFLVIGFGVMRAGVRARGAA